MAQASAAGGGGQSTGSSLRVKVQRFGSYLSGMVMPNIGAFIAWGLITALFIETGWLPNATLAELVGPMITYLLPLLIGFTGGRLVYDVRGGVVGAIATMGVIVGTDIPMFLGALIMGPLGGYAIMKFDQLLEGKVRQGFEMLINNFSAGIIGGLLAIVGLLGASPIVTALSNALGSGVDFIVGLGLLPLVSIFVEPAKILFLNNAINHGIIAPLALDQAQDAGSSILFLVETNPGPGLGILLACMFVGRGVSKRSAPGAAIIHFLGGIHEIYFPYVLMRPLLILAAIAGGASGLFIEVLFGVGLVSTPSPGSIFAILALTARGSFIGVVLGVLTATTVSFLVTSVILRRSAPSEADDENLTRATESMQAMKGSKSPAAGAINGASKTNGQEDQARKIANAKSVVFACDAGMGSSAMGASLLRKKAKEAGLSEIEIKNASINQLPSDADVVITHKEERVLVDRVTAFHSVDEADEVVRRLAAADLITTAVGPPVLPILAPALAKGLVRRARSVGGPVNVIACENMIGGSEALRSSVMEHVSDKDAEMVAEVAGFPNTAVDRIVPEQTAGGLDVLVEPFFEWVVDASRIKGVRPDVEGITYVESLAPYIDRKLLTVNTGHAAVAYLGYAHGRETISDALEDKAVLEQASGALEETGRLLVEERGFDPDEHRAYIKKVLGRFRNPRITDAVTRVARTPIRKLGRNERLVSPALRLLDRGHTPVHLATVIGAVLRYDDPNDEQARELRETIRAVGESSALSRYAGIEEDHPLVDLVVEQAGRV